MRDFKEKMNNGFDKVAKVVGKFTIIALLVAGVVFVGYTKFAKAGDDDIIDTGDGWKKTEESKVDTTETTFYNIERELKACGKLTTYEQPYSGSGEVINKKKGIITGHDYEITKNSVTFDYTGTIEVGYNFEDIDYKLSNGKIIVSYPKPEIFANYAEATNVKENDNILNDAKGGEAVTTKLAEEKENELNKAIEGGIYTKAEENLKAMITEQFAELSDCDLVFKTKLVNQ